MGASFLTLLEALAKQLSTASDLMAPLGAYKEVGKGLTDSVSSSAVSDATVSWLAAAQVSPGGRASGNSRPLLCLSSAQVNANLRSFGSLSRNDVQCMTYSRGVELPVTISAGLNRKVDDLLRVRVCLWQCCRTSALTASLCLQAYASELQKAPQAQHRVPGGFHLNPKGIEQALKVATSCAACCSLSHTLGVPPPPRTAAVRWRLWGQEHHTLRTWLTRGSR